CVSPVDGSFTGPQMRIAVPVVVMDVRRADVRFQHAKRLVNGAGHVRVSGIKAHAEIRIMQRFQQLLQLLWSGKVVGSIFHQQADAKLPAESAEVLNAAHGPVEFTRIVVFISLSDVLHEKPKRHLFGNFHSAFDLIHGVDSARFVRIDNIQRRAAGFEVVAHVDWRMHGVQFHSFTFEPRRKFLDVFFVGVIEVAAGSKQLHSLDAATFHRVEQAGMQPLFDVNVARHCAQHQNPTAFPPLRPSDAPSNSPVFGSTAMHSPSLQYPSSRTWWPRACRSLIVSGEMPTLSIEITSGSHWWWKRGAFTAC